MSQLADGSIHKFLTGETVTGDDTQVSTNLNIALNLLRLAGNDTDTKVGNTYTKAQTDSALGVRDSAIAQLSIGQIPPAPNGAPIPVSLGNGLQVVNVGVGSPYNVLNIVGRTLVNLLGRVGNCEDVSQWSTVASNATLSLDTTNKTIGSNGMKVTLTAASGSGYKAVTFKANKYYIVVGDVKNGNATNAYINLDSLGITQTITDTTKFNTVYKKVNPAIDTNVNISLYLNGANTQFAYFDAVRWYEISQSEYNAIDSMAADQIAAKYPYVDDVKHVNAPYVIKYGENLLPTFNEWTTINANTSIIDPYKASTTANGTDLNNVATIPVIVGQQYTLSVSKVGGKIGVDFVKQDGTSFNSTGFQDVSTLTITAPTDAVSARIFLTTASQASGAVTFTNPMLNLGATAKTFKPRNDDSLFFPNTQLASSVDGTVYDQIFKRDGKYFRENRFVKDMVLDGSLAASYVGTFTGGKTVKLQFGALNNSLSGTAKVVKYDGKILTTNPGTWNTNDTDDIEHNVNDYIWISASSTDTGWGDAYTPLSAEIQAYFYGWKMYIWGGADSATYNGTGQKGWSRRKDGTTTLFDGTTTLPTTPSVGLTPYKLTYQLAAPTFEEIQVDAGMSLHEGLNQIEVGQGVQVREKIIPAVSVAGTYYAFNTSEAGYTANPLLKYRNNSIIAIYRNGLRDYKWTIDPNGTPYGKYRAYIPTASYDPTATYEVSYIALDQYLLSSSVQAVNGEVASNLKTVVDTLSTNQADQDARIAANEIIARQLYPIQKVLNGGNPWGDNTLANRSAIRCTATSTQSISANTNTKVNFGTKVYDNLTEFNTSTSTFTAQQSGLYNITAEIETNGIPAQGNIMITLVYINGSAYQDLAQAQQAPSGGTYGSVTCGSTVVKLNVGDTINIYAVSSNAITLNSGNAGNVTITRIA